MRQLEASWRSEGRPYPQQMIISSSSADLSGLRRRYCSNAPGSPPPWRWPPTRHHHSNHCGCIQVHSGSGSALVRPAFETDDPVEGLRHMTHRWNNPRGKPGRLPLSQDPWHVCRPGIDHSASHQIICGHHKKLKFRSNSGIRRNVREIPVLIIRPELLTASKTNTDNIMVFI